MQQRRIEEQGTAYDDDDAAPNHNGDSQKRHLFAILRENKAKNWTLVQKITAKADEFSTHLKRPRSTDLQVNVEEYLRSLRNKGIIAERFQSRKNRSTFHVYTDRQLSVDALQNLIRIIGIYLRVPRGFILSRPNGDGRTGRTTKSISANHMPTRRSQGPNLASRRNGGASRHQPQQDNAKGPARRENQGRHYTWDRCDPVGGTNLPVQGEFRARPGGRAFRLRHQQQTAKGLARRESQGNQQNSYDPAGDTNERLGKRGRGNGRDLDATDTEQTPTNRTSR